MGWGVKVVMVMAALVAMIDLTAAAVAAVVVVDFV